MAKQKKNSNYQTEKTANEKALKEEQKQKEKQAKQIKLASIIAGASAGFIALLMLILFIAGAFDYVPETTYHATVEVEGYGSLHIALYGEDAPQAVDNFIELAGKGYFDGMYFHTFIDGLLYGGGENADAGRGGIKGEFSANGVENKILMKKGVVCMARGDDYDSAYDQFFILTENNSELSGNYAAFGKVTDMETLNAILKAIETNADGSITEDSAPKITKISLHEAHD